MAWIELSQNAVKARLTAAEMETLLAGTGRATDMDVLGEIIKQVVSMVRAKVAACRDNLPNMGPPGTIPEECLHAAVTIARSSFITSFPAAGMPDPRKAELDAATKFLDEVAACSVSIATPSGEYPGGGGVVFGGDPLLNFHQ